MKYSNPLPIVLAVASALLSACTSYEQIRLRDQGPSPEMDHCLACMDLGEAWAMFRMGEYEQADITCSLVIEQETNPDSRHARRARDISSLAKGYVALRARDYPVAWAHFREIRDPQLRDLGKPYVDSSRGWLASSAASSATAATAYLPARRAASAEGAP
jgi:hypothetical protein